AIPKLSEISSDFADAAKNANLAGAAVSILTTAFEAGVWIVDQYGNAVARTSIAIETLANASSGFAEIARNVGPRGLIDDGSLQEGIRQVEEAFAQGQRQLDKLIQQQENRNRSRSGGLPPTTVDPRTQAVPADFGPSAP